MRRKKIIFLLMIISLSAFIICRTVNTVNKNKYIEAQHAIVEATESGDYEQVKKLLRKYPEFVRHRNDLLCIALRRHHQEIARLLISNGADVNTGGERPLYIALHERDETMTKLLIDSGAYVNARDRDGNTPLHLAVRWKCGRVLELLISKGVEINAENNMGLTALQCAISGYNVEASEILVTRGADVNTKDTYGMTPLQYALMEYRYREYMWRARKITTLLYRYGAEISDIFSAAAVGSIDKIKSYVEKDPETVNDKDKERGATPLIWAVRFDRLEVAQFLLSHGADIKAKDEIGQSPLANAAFYGGAYMAEFLISKGADVNETGGFPISIAVQQGDFEMTKLLILKGAKVNLEFKPLHYAAWQWNKEVVKLLIDCGADVNARGTYPYPPPKSGTRWTPLQVAADRGRDKIAEILIHAGADVNARNDEGKTALYYAEHQGYSEVTFCYHFNPDLKDMESNTNYDATVRILKKHGAVE